MENSPLKQWFEPALIIFIFCLVFFVNLPFAAFNLLSPDACVYLDIARNIFNGHPGMVSINIYQAWKGIYYPVWPYTQFIFSFICAPVLKLFGVGGVISLNISLLAVNSCFAYILARRYAGIWAGLFAAFIVGFSYASVFNAIYPWTEQLSLALSLIALYLFIEGKCGLFYLGAFFASLCFVRAANIYIIFGMLPVIVFTHGRWRDGAMGCLRFGLGALAVLGTYQIFCFLLWGELYPSYIHYAYIYNVVKPMIQGGDWLKSISYFRELGMLFDFALYFFTFALIDLIFIFSARKQERFLCLFFAGAVNLCFVVVASQGVYLSEWLRMLYFSFAVLVIAGVCGVFRFYARFKGTMAGKVLSVVIVGFAVVSLVFTGFGYIDYRKEIAQYAATADKSRLTHQPAYDWVKKNTAKNSLVAVDYMHYMFLIERPLISLPKPGGGDAGMFIARYKPDYIILSAGDLLGLYTGFGYKVSFSENGINVLSLETAFKSY